MCSTRFWDDPSFYTYVGSTNGVESEESEDKTEEYATSEDGPTEADESDGQDGTTDEIGGTTDAAPALSHLSLFRVCQRISSESADVLYSPKDFSACNQSELAGNAYLVPINCRPHDEGRVLYWYQQGQPQLYLAASQQISNGYVG